MKINLTILIIFFLNTIGCKDRTEIKTVDIENKISRNDISSIKLSEFIEELDYISLETGKGFLIGENPKYSITKEKIIVRTKSDCLIFDRTNGKFLRKVGNKGRGPNEFQNTNGMINLKSQSIYLKGIGANLLKYDFEGKFIKSISIPEYRDDFISPSFPGNYTWLGNNIVCYFSNMIGNETKRLVIFNDEGENLVVYPNKIFFEKSKSLFTISVNESQFYHFRNDLFFKEDYSDTVYQVSLDHLTPHMILYLGKYQTPPNYKSLSANELQKNNFIGIRNLIETERLLLFEFYYQNEYFQGVFNKKTSKLKIAKKNGGIINDLDNFIQFSPTLISEDEFLIDVVDAYILNEWFKINQGRINKLPVDVQNLNSIKENDNPVVIIAKLKE